MAGPNDTFSADQLREHLRYCPESGQFERLTGPMKGCPVGARADCNGKSPRITITILRKRHKAHRLAWLYMTGEWPEKEIDHIDGDGTNNRWSNLRLATHQQNRQNNRAYKNSKLGVLGVHQRSNGRFYPYIHIDGKMKRLGGYATLDEAIAVRKRAASEVYGEFAPL